MSSPIVPSTDTLYLNVLRKTMNDKLPRTKNKSAVCRPVRIEALDNYHLVDRCTYDSGASSANYIGLAALQALSVYDKLTIEACDHTVKLGDGASLMTLNKKLTISVIPIDDYGNDLDPIMTDLYIVDTMGDEIIIGLPSLLAEFYDYFASILAKAARRPVQRSKGAEQVIEFLDDICDRLEDELYSKEPCHRKLDKLVKKARAAMIKYNNVKDAVLKDQERATHQVVEETGFVTEYLISSAGVVLADDRLQRVVDDMEYQVATYQNHPPGQLLRPFEHLDAVAIEELETPDPLSFNQDILNFMESSVEDSKKIYHEELAAHVSLEMQQAVPEIMQLLRSPLAEERFAPSTWHGLQNVNPIDFELKGTLPARLAPKPRPVRPALWEHAKLEFNRLRKYFYTDSTSPIASPLVIAPKATAPFIRFCGDYRVINDFIKIPQEPIPNVPYALSKAANFPIYVDLDMTNSFHQLPLAPASASLLSVQTPWGLVQPLFLPEGVGPASGYLQKTVREIFSDCDDWIIVIFDNFLILANDYMDAYVKLKKVLERCDEFKIVLKLKKSYIGVKTTTFFGYEISHQKWRLSDSRKKSIEAMLFPSSKKAMQSFLGAALFFHHHVPNYSDWSARLYEMTNEHFSWDETTWKFDYRNHFESFKQCLCDATEIYFPDYSLKWVVRCDASDIAVAGLLYQERPMPDGSIRHEPIMFLSHKFSESAKNWDTFKKEGYGLYFTVNGVQYYLRGKEFIVETDHRNLQWMAASQSPIVVRWRTLLQSYTFMIRHIPGKDNKVADWMSRMYSLEECMPCLMLMSPDNSTSISFDEVMHNCHGRERLHFGAYETWRRAKLAYPELTINIEAVRTFVKECGICNKMRDTGVKGFHSIKKSLKPTTYRRRIGIDHLTITPADKHGFCAAVVIVEHFSHFCQIYPVKNYDEQTLAGILIQHFSTFGLFDEIISDPGSALMGNTIKWLNNIFGVTHSVSLIGRHESNGVEGTNKQILRHLTTLVLESGIKDRWSEPTVLPLINYFLNDRPTNETGGFTPFQLKYGTQDANFFKLPSNVLPEHCSAEILKLLDQDLKTLRDTSLKFQTQLATQRTKGNYPIVHYQAGDLILWNPREHSRAFKESKLSPNWLGPYKVLEQKDNDIKCVHLCMGTTWTFHNDRVKPYPDTEAQGIIDARLDYNQFVIKSFNSFSGNPHLRTSMQFSIDFIVNEEIETSLVNYSNDIADTEQFSDYVHSINYLFPLRYAASLAKLEINKINKSSIKDINVNDVLWLNLRFFDGKDRTWFDSLNLPNPEKIYVVSTVVKQFSAKNRSKIVVFANVFNQTYNLTSYDVLSCTFTDHVFSANSSAFINVTSELCKQYPQLLM